MRHRGLCRLGCALALLLGSVASAAGQVTELGARGPRFLAATATSPTPVSIDVRRVAVLRQRVSLDLTNATLEEALAEITRQSGLRFMYSKDLVASEGVVQLQARRITVAAALTELLVDAGVDVVLTADGQAMLARQTTARPMARSGTVVGRVTDVKTGEGLAGADVSLEGTEWRASTGEDGRYRIAAVEPGSYTLAVRRIGYRRESRAVTVVDGEEVVVDVGLEAVPTQLDEVVTTVTGEQRLRELGHVVGRINADSLVKEAPISSLSDLLMGRVAGLQVSQSQGTVGGEVKLQVRGPNSINLSTEPIVIVDGVRYVSDGPLGGSHEPTSPLNDLNPNDIESIEVVKGPSAATLYGTDAANGVIVITTKRGRAGPARWNAYARMARTSIPTAKYDDRYVAYGTRPSGAIYTRCGLQAMAAAVCAQDSIVAVPNPLNDPDLTIFGSQPRQEVGLSVAGGSQDTRYYFAAGYEDAVGPVVMPRAALEFLEQQRGTELPDDWRQPNTRTNLNLRANVTAQLGTQGELSVHAGYIRGATQRLAVNNPYATGVFEGTPGEPYGDEYRPEEVFARQATERTDRFVGNATAQWRPAPWLVTRATLGLDLGTRRDMELVRRGDAPSSFLSSGFVRDARARRVATTADLSATATARRGRLSARTSVGVQYVRTLNDALFGSGFNLPPGGSSVSEAATRSSGQSYTETVTLGSYVEETLGLNDRLFLTGALRIDGASAFGRNYDAAVYPKVSASWLASEEPFFPWVPGLDELRLRYAYGASGQQPDPAWARPEYAPSNSSEPGFVNDAPQTVLRLTSVGNPNVRPERVREHEFGFDVVGLGNRINLGLTWYHRRTIDQLVSVPLASGYGSWFTNLGLTTQHGFEAELTAHVVDTRLVSWDVVARHGLQRTRLVDLGGGSEEKTPYGGYVEGYPLGARFQPVLVYADANGDGLLADSEFDRVQSFLGEKRYAGESAPPIAQTLTTMVGLFDRRVRLSALVERRAGFTQINGLKTEQCHRSGCLAALDPSTPLAQQAEALAVGDRYAFLEPGDYTRLREVTVALDLPPSFLRALRVRSATVSFSGRNLALWTDFSSGDPESSAPSSLSAGGIPQGRTWTVRLDVGF